ncbi:MAG: alpha/beta fold hydrolase [Gammaproteobacteria bacterium]|nr:alpha/beta fold hydrolase [Gammaproteobacteria bacterium]
MTRPLPAMLLAVALLVITLLAVLPFLVLWWVTPSAPLLLPVAGEQLATLDGGRMRFEQEGSGADAIVLLHGFNGQLGHWNGVWSHLGDCAVRLRLDAPGFGGSRWPTDDYGLAAQARRVIALLDARGLARVTLVGTSMGGSLAAYIAAYYPERVGRLALLAPSGYSGALRYPGLYGAILRPGWARDWAMRIARSRVYRALFPRSHALQALSVTASYGSRWVAVLPRIQAPTLIVWSRGDEGVSHTRARATRAAIRGSELLWLDAASGHLIPQTRPELIAALSCGLADGALPAAAVRRLPPGLLRAGEALEPR